ncbi:excinuclease ABC subunit C [Bacillus toyonensis]|uniref:excinuclease ABC subunit C n=1 Tax=Bacillus toyonensis TaxID=155322 RepID=UPI000BF4DDDF|nr:excinuclease ABC subunit C [Bacillus toyonensis]PGE68195.1 excinuclease ABC subunit C [Bacillus toyonensis]PHD44962.1 excinuclease ABC subunit C [Bacillus toyonensis]
MTINTIKIDNVKEQVKRLIQDNSYREVTPETRYKVSGIYMIYIDNFSNDKVVPIYIGQSKDIQRRYKEHFCEILSLNRLPHENYYEYFFSEFGSYYEGKFKACKIFKYMIENNCTLKDFRMIILEETDEAGLERKEQEYFQKLLPSFFGFNQLNSFLANIKFKFKQDKLTKLEINNFLDICQKDIDNIYSYYEYGFTQFNFKHAFRRDIMPLLKRAEQLDDATLSKCKEVNSNIYQLFSHYNLESEIHAVQELNVYYRDYLMVKKQYEDLLNQQPTGIIIKFLKNIGLFNKKEKKLEHIVSKKRNEWMFHRKAYNTEQKILLHKRYQLIFPICEFRPFSLKDKPNTISLKVDKENSPINTCYLQIYISNNGINRSEHYSKEPYIIRIDYCYINPEGKEIQKEYYIKNETTEDCRRGIAYIEKDFHDPYATRPNPFTISRFRRNKIDNSFISILSEYKHGVNDYTITDKRLYKLETVFNRLQKLTDTETKFTKYASESDNCLKKCISNEQLDHHPFVKRLPINKKK